MLDANGAQTRGELKETCRLFFTNKGEAGFSLFSPQTFLLSSIRRPWGDQSVAWNEVFLCVHPRASGWLDTRVVTDPFRPFRRGIGLAGWSLNGPDAYLIYCRCGNGAGTSGRLLEESPGSAERYAIETLSDCLNQLAKQLHCVLSFISPKLWCSFKRSDKCGCWWRALLKFQLFSRLELRWMRCDYQRMGIDFPGKRFIRSFIFLLQWQRGSNMKNSTV